MSVRGIARRATAVGYAHGTNAPIYVNSSNSDSWLGARNLFGDFFKINTGMNEGYVNKETERKNHGKQEGNIAPAVVAVVLHTRLPLMFDVLLFSDTTTKIKTKSRI